MTNAVGGKQLLPVLMPDGKSSSLSDTASSSTVNESDINTSSSADAASSSKVNEPDINSSSAADGISSSKPSEADNLLSSPKGSQRNGTDSDPISQVLQTTSHSSHASPSHQKLGTNRPESHDDQPKPHEQSFVPSSQTQSPGVMVSIPKSQTQSLEVNQRNGTLSDPISRVQPITSHSSEIQSELKNDIENQNGNTGDHESNFVLESQTQSSKEQRIACSFLFSELLSVLLQIFVIYGDKNRGCFLVGDKNGARCLTDKNCFCLIAGSVLSLICLVLTITNRSTKETDPRLSQLRKQIKVVDLCFTLVQFLSAVVNLFDDKSANYVSLIFPPLYAAINVVFTCPEVTSKIIQNIRGTALKIREWWKKIKYCLTGNSRRAEESVETVGSSQSGKRAGARAEKNEGSGQGGPYLRRRHGKGEQRIRELESLLPGVGKSNR